MITANLPRVMIAGCSSGSGKTSAACGLMRALNGQGLRVRGFKCGPDYIDPMYHKLATGAASRNLDLFMCGAQTVKYLFGSNARGVDISVVEGVMGLYDGVADSDRCSSNHIADATRTPVIIVFDPKGAALSAAAALRGFLTFRENNIKGVIFNNVSAKMYGFYRDMIQSELGLRAFGYLPRTPEAAFGSRCLGLMTPDGAGETRRKIDTLGEQCAQTLDIAGILELARESPEFGYEDVEIDQIGAVRIGAAMDEAFCFYYADNLALLERLGAEIIPFSPLADARLPEGIHGLLLPGGYPEEYAARLAANAPMLASVRAALCGGLPCLAECGGFMYLARSLADRDGAVHKMAGFIGADCAMTGGLKRFGYVTLTANADNLLCDKGATINAHEFHYGDCGDAGRGFTAAKPNGAAWDCVHSSPALYAGFPHLHLWGNVDFARNFIRRCAEYKSREKGALC